MRFLLALALAAPAAAQPLNPVEVWLGDLARVLHARGARLSAGDIHGLLHPDYLNDGLDRDLEAREFATFLRGTSLESFQVTRLDKLDAEGAVLLAGGWADLRSAGGRETRLFLGAGRESLALGYFRRVGERWLLSGNGRPAGLSAHHALVLRREPGGEERRSQFTLQAAAPAGAVDAVEARFASGTRVALPREGLDTVEVVHAPRAGESVPMRTDRFSVWMSSAPEPGPVTFVVVARGGPAWAGRVEPAPAAAAVPEWRTPAGHALADARLGRPLEVRWRNPRGLDIAELELIAGIRAGERYCEIDIDDGLLGPGAESATITLPEACDGEPVVARAAEAEPPVVLMLFVKGTRGERVRVEHVLR